MARYFHRPILGIDIYSENQSILLKRLLLEGIRIRKKLNSGEEDVNKSMQDIESIVRDISVAILGKDITEFEEELDSLQYPNGVKHGVSNFVRDEVLYDNMPPMMTTEEFENGEFKEGGSYYPPED